MSTCLHQGAQVPLRSQKALQFLDRHARIGENPAKRSLRDVASRVNRHRRAPAVEMAHDVMTARDPRP